LWNGGIEGGASSKPPQKARWCCTATTRQAAK
jgi:hypothetical protein